MKRAFAALVVFLFGGLCVYAQTSIQIDPAVAVEHLLDHPKPVYPPIARAAHIGGTVVMVAVIDEQGKVADLSVISGPPMLQEAALQAVRQFTFTPFEHNGKTVSAATFIGIQFTLGVSFSTGSVAVVKNLKVDSGMMATSDFLTAYSACNRQVEQPSAGADAVKLCQDAVQKAATLPSNSSALRAANVAYATALIHDGKPGAAIDPGNRAIAAAQGNRNDVAGASAAYAVTGEALALTGNLPEADRNFSTAEKFAQKAVNEMPTHSSYREQRSQTLKALLEYHAKILTKMGNEKEAQKKLKEAAKL